MAGSEPWVVGGSKGVVISLTEDLLEACGWKNLVQEDRKWGAC